MATSGYEWAGGCTASRLLSANDAGAELERIRQKNSGLNAADVVEESRPEDAVLHGCFEWDDSKAGELYRQNQAQNIIRNIRVVDTGPKGPVKVRAYIRTVPKTYEPLKVVLTTPALRNSMMEECKRDLRRWLEKYRTVREVSGVLTSMEEILRELEAGPNG